MVKIKQFEAFTNIFVAYLKKLGVPVRDLLLPILKSGHLEVQWGNLCTFGVICMFCKTFLLLEYCLEL